MGTKFPLEGMFDTTIQFMHVARHHLEDVRAALEALGSPASTQDLWDEMVRISVSVYPGKTMAQISRLDGWHEVLGFPRGTKTLHACVARLEGNGEVERKRLASQGRGRPGLGLYPGRKLRKRYEIVATDAGPSLREKGKSTAAPKHVVLAQLIRFLAPTYLVFKVKPDLFERGHIKPAAQAQFNQYLDDQVRLLRQEADGHDLDLFHALRLIERNEEVHVSDDVLRPYAKAMARALTGKRW